MRIEHIALYVKDLEAVGDFFVTYLGVHSNDGYHNISTGFRSFFISFDDGARLEIMTRPEMADAEKALKALNLTYKRATLIIKKRFAMAPISRI